MTVADLDHYADLLERASALTTNGPPPPALIEPLRDFLQRPLPKSEALVGAARGGTNLLPRYGWVMPWGREGSGKTSILVDLIFHAAAGINWLHYHVPRPIRIVAIINEGVPGGLQDKLQHKRDHWPHDIDAVLDNVAIYASPWGEFTFRNTDIADHARQYAVDFQADYVALDPLHTLGTVGAGTPQETEQFKHTLRDFGLWRDLGIITAHHSNKNGMVSGDWARHPDTVIRIEKDGKRPATKITLEKARPADPAELGVPQLLEWETDTLSYRRVSLNTIKVTDEELAERIHAALEQAGQPMTKTALRAAVEGNKDRVSAVIDAELRAGRIIDDTPEKRSSLLRPSTPEGRRGEPGAKPAQTRMNTDNSSPLDTEGRKIASPTAVSSPHPPPPKGGVRGELNEGPTEPEPDEYLWRARIADEPDLTETEWEDR